MKFTRTMEQQRYSLTGGVFVHNHPLTTAVLDPAILQQLDNFDPCETKPAFIKKLIFQKFNKSISYAQIAYEMSKRQKPLQIESIGKRIAVSDVKL